VLRLRSRLVLVVVGSALAACNRDPEPARPALASEGDEPVQHARAPALAALAPGVARAAEPKAPERCSKGMVLVEGMYCPELKQTCKRYLDGSGRYQKFRCAEYGPSQCVAPKKQLRFCMDQDEYVEPGEALPKNHVSHRDAAATCSAQGKRLCLESEYNFACEGEELRPYPYGFKRDASACNADRSEIINSAGRLRDLRSPVGAYPRCVSPFGVRNLAGNLEEFVTIDGTRPARPAMKGSYWQPGRNNCRAAQTAHDSGYSGIETGFRCCSDAK
jgi:formylglycine-generating enzyme